MEPIPLADGTFSGEVWNLVAPQFLPGERAALVSAVGPGLRLSVITLETGQRTDIVTGAWMGRLVDGETLVYARKGELWAVRFDPLRLKKAGEPVRVVDSAQSELDYQAEYAVSTSGTLVYSKPLAVKGRNAHRLVWVDRQDRIEPVTEVPGGWWLAPRVSPDGSRIMFWGWPFDDYAGGRVWLFDRSGRAPRALTDEAYTSGWPIFSRDGRSAVSNSDRDGKGNFPLWDTPLDDRGAPAQLTKLATQPGTMLAQQPSSLSPDGQTLAFQQMGDPRTGFDLYLLTLTGDHGVRPLLVTKHNERLPVFSPDGRWLAYVSDESGRDEVYARHNPEFGTPVQLSSDGGDGPLWSWDGSDLYFAKKTGIFAVSFLDGRAGAPRQLVNGRQQGSRNALVGPSPAGRMYDVARDGRFLMLQQEDSYPNGAEYQVVLNWLTDVRARFARRK